MNWFGRMLVNLGATPPPDDDFWYRPAPEIGNGIYVSPSNALQSTAVYACVNVIAQTCSTLPFNVYRRLFDTKGNRVGKAVAYDHPLYAILHDSPNDEMTSPEFWEIAFVHLLTWGNFYARIEMDDRQTVLSLHPLSPDRMNVTRDRVTGIRVYNYTDPQDGQTKQYVENEILHIPGPGWDGLKGYSPVELQRGTIELERVAKEYGARFFRNNATPPSYISVPNVLSDKSADNLLSWFGKKFGGFNQHKMGILQGGAEIKTVAIDHQKSQFLELRRFQLEEVARIYRVAPHLIQALDRATNNNIEHQGIDAATYTFRPWCVRVEKRCNKSLLGPREAITYFCEINMDGLMRGDAASRATYYAQRITSGNMTPNEARSRENDNPIEGGDELYIQGAMVPLRMAGQQQQQQGVTK